jgi:hypothetical protein
LPRDALSWHPWNGQTVWIGRQHARGGCPVFQCSLDPSSTKRLLEIPQWMFDASVVCLLRLQSSPVASCEALHALKELVTLSLSVRRANDVVQARHQSLSSVGGSDAPRHEVQKGQSAAAISPTGRTVSLGEFASRGSAPDTTIAGAMATRSRKKRRKKRGATTQPGGGR